MRSSVFSPAAVLLALGLSALGGTSVVAVTVEEQVVAPVHPGAAYLVSPAGQRIATVTMKGSRHVILVDGVEGPLLDQLLQVSGQPYYDRNAGMNIAGQLPPLVFSADGTRYAYAGRQGREVIVVLDGREFARLPLGATHPNLFTYGPLRFSPGGKWLYYVHHDGGGRPRLVVNGQPGPELAVIGDPLFAIAFSPDDSRWAYAATPTGKRDETILIVDGKEANYVPAPAVYEQLAFRADGKLVCVAKTKEGAALLVDSKVAVRAAQVQEIVTAPRGASVAALIVKPGQNQAVLWLDGKEVAGTEGVVEVLFSPDGKRYAALCGRPGNQWIVSDGRKHAEYQGVRGNKLRGALFGIEFTPDSSKLVYAAQSGSRHFVVIEGEESDGFQSTPPRVIIGTSGANIAFHGQSATDASNQRTVVVNGKKYPAPNTIRHDSFTFSPDGSRHAWFVNRVSPDYLFVDGEEQGFNRASAFFSPDSRHVAVAGTHEKTNKWGLYVNGQHVHEPPRGGRLLEYRAFTPDSRHLYWTSSTHEQRPDGARIRWTLHLDGQPAVTFERPHRSIPFIPTAYFRGGDANFDTIPFAWHMAENGTLTFLEWTEGAVKRFRVTPSPATSVASMLAGATGATAVAAPAAQAQVTAVKAVPARTVVATPAIAAPAAPVDPLDWSQLVRRREAWPVEAKLLRELRFAGGATVRAGSAIAIVELKSGEVVATGNRGAITFSVEPDATDVLAVANATWAAFSPVQRDLTYTKLARSPELWPYEVKLAVPVELGGGPSLPAGSPVLFLGYEKDQLLLRIPKTDTAFNLEPENTDLLAQARAFLASERGAPGRLLEEFATAPLVDPATNRAVRLDPGQRPKYVVMYMGAGWCAPCKVFAPKLMQVIKDRSPAAGDVAFVFLSGDKTPAAARQYTSSLGLTWPMLTFTNRGQLPAFQPLFGTTIPQLVVTDRHGTVVIDSAKVGQDRALAQLKELL